MDDSETAMATVARLIEQLHTKTSSPQDKELTTACLLGLARGRKEARTLIGSHAQAMPLFISLLRGGTPVAKVNVAATLSALCKNEDLRLKVLLGGCIPPLLSMLKSESMEARKAAAEAIYEVSSAGLLNDHVGMKIFITEGVVPTLWDQLDPKKKEDKVVEGFVTGALRNLCGDNDGYWRAALEGGGVDIIVGLLSSHNPAAQSNAASLLARLILAFGDCLPRILDSGVVKALLQLLGESNDIAVRASAADALEALSLKATEAKIAVEDAGGIHVLIEAIVAPSKECMQEEHGQALQGHATRALANVCGGMAALILYLGKLSQSSRLAEPVTDIIGALAYALMIFEQSSETDDEAFDPKAVESILVKLLKPRDTKLIQERILEAMASLYGNKSLSRWLNDAGPKRVLIALITMASSDVHEHLINCLSRLCRDEVGIWEAIGKREGIQLLISFLGLSSAQHQEFAVEMLGILTDQVDDSKWAVTAAGGIPPLVHLLETGSQKAKEDAACVLWNLCCHSEDIRLCVERAGAIPSFLWLLKNGGPKAQETSAKTLIKLVRTGDPATINQLLGLLLGDSPPLKVHVIGVLGHVLAEASKKDLVHKGSAANNGLRSLVQSLTSSNEETKKHAASILADLLSSREDICDNLVTDDIINPCMKLLTSNTPNVATQLARALGALSRSVKKKTSKKESCITEGDVQPLIKLAKNSSIESAEIAIAALANLLSDLNIAAEALAEDIVSALIRVLADGTLEGKKNASRALHQLLEHFPVFDVLKGSAQSRFAIFSLVDFLKSVDMNSNDAIDALEVVALVVRTKHGVDSSYPPCSVLAEAPSSLESLVHCLVEGHPLVQEKAIEILSRICSDEAGLLGQILVTKSKSIGFLADRIMNSTSLEVRVGGAALLICAAKEQKQLTMDALDLSGFSKPLLYALVDMIKQNCKCSSEIKVRTPRGFVENNVFQDAGEFHVPDPATVLGGTVALWLLCIITSFHPKNRLIVMEAGGLEALSEKLASFTSSPQVEYEDAEGMWISALLLAIMFQDANVVLSPTTVCIIPSLALLLRSDELMDRYFTAQALASLVSNKNKGINFTIATSGAIPGIINLLGYVESDMPSVVALSKVFSLVRKPDEVVLQHLFEVEDVRVGSTARKSIPLLVDLLRPIPDRPGAPPFAVRLLTRIVDGSDMNKIVMAESGAIDALAKYLSLSPQDATELTITELLRMLFSNPELKRNEAALSSLNQLIAVLHLGSRSARYSTAGTLCELFDAENVRTSDLAWQAVQPLIDMLNTASEREQEWALSALVKLTSGNSLKTTVLTDLEGNQLENVSKLLSSSSSSMELKINAARLCSVVFGNENVRTSLFASECMEPLVSLMRSGTGAAVEAGVCAFEKLLDDEQQLELASSYDILNLLIGLISGSNNRLVEVTIAVLIKLGKDRAPRKLDMVKAGIVDTCLKLLPSSPSSLCSSISELFRILTNSGAIARSTEAVKIVEPLFMVLLRSDLTLWGQHSALQALVNILEKPQSLAAFNLAPSEVIEPLISFLESPSQAIQQLSTELLSHCLSKEEFQQDITTQNAVKPLVQLTGIGILNLQQTAIKALESISASWPKAVVDAGGIFEISKVILQEDPQPLLPLWESAAFVLSNVLHSNAEYYFRVPLVVLVKMLFSTVESTVIVALKALIAHEKIDASSGTQMAEAGAIDALLDLLISHHCEEESGSLLEALFNNVRVRELKICKYAIVPLSQYLLDPQTRSESSRLLAALSLGDLSQHERLARSSGSVSACRALVGILEDESTEELKMVAICALQNFVMHSRTNRRAVAEAGGILLIQELLLSCNAEVVGQAALMIKFLFSNHTLQEYVSNELIRSLTAALERGLWSTSTVNIEVLKTLNVIFTNFPKLRASEATTLCIPHLVGALKSSGEDIQESVLDTLYLLKHSWSNMPIDTAKSQAMIAAEAIPTLQMLMKTGPPRFHEKVDNLLHCLPGCLTVNVKRGNNLRQSMGTTNAFCQLTIGNCPPRQTRVVSHSSSPEWKEGFTWAFNVPPKGQKLHIVCKTKSTFGKTTLGRVTIQIDKVVTEGVYSGSLSLNHNRNKDDASSRSLEIEIIWSNRTSDDST